MSDFGEPAGASTSEAAEVADWQARWSRARYYSVKRAPYYALFLHKLRPVYAPGTGTSQVGGDWECRIDPELIASDGDAWRLQLLWAHHIYFGDLDPRRVGDRDPSDWARACSLAACDVWEPIMSKEETEIEYPGSGWPAGLTSPRDLGLPSGLAAEQYYDLIHANNLAEKASPAAAATIAEPEDAVQTHAQGVPAPGETDSLSGTGEAASPDGADASPGQQGSGAADPLAGGSGPPKPTPQNGPSSSGSGQPPQMGLPGLDSHPSGSIAPASGGPAGGASDPAPRSDAVPGPMDLAGSEPPQDPQLDARQRVVTEEIAREVSRDPGSVPGNLQRTPEATARYTADLEKRIRKLVGKTEGRVRFKWTGRMSARNMNHPDEAVLPERRYGLPEVKFLIDTSLSMRGEILHAGLQLAEQSLRITKTRLAAGDRVIQRNDSKKLTRTEIHQLLGGKALPGGGGTDMAGCVREIHDRDPDKPILTFTDGLFAWPSSPRELKGARVTWLVLEHPSAKPEIPAWCEKDVVRVQRTDLVERGLL